MASYLYLLPLVAGVALVGLSAFTGAFSRRWGDRRGAAVTAVLRNLLGIPLAAAGFLWAWSRPEPLLFDGSWRAPAGWLVFVVAMVPIFVGHYELGMRTHFPTAHDALYTGGLYGIVRHPIYAGFLLALVGVGLLRPTTPVLLASLVVMAWCYVQARLEEIDLIDRVPGYREYMARVPRFIPRLRRGRGLPA